MHNLLFILSVSSHGLIVFFDGPHLGRGTDRTAFRNSEMKTRFEAGLIANNMNLDDFGQLGDKIFVNRPPCFRALLLNTPNEAVRVLDRIDSKCRTSVEWANGKATENWKSITYLSFSFLLVSKSSIFIIASRK